MKSLSKIGLDILTYSAVITIGAGAILPTIVAAEAATSTSASEVDSSIESTVLLNDSSEDKINLEGRLDIEKVSEENDIAFFNQISIEKNENDLVVSLYDELDTYGLNDITYTGEHNIEDDGNGMNEIYFSDFINEATISISLTNKNTLVEYKLLIRLTSAELIDLAENIEIELQKNVSEGSLADTEVNEEATEEATETSEESIDTGETIDVTEDEETSIIEEADDEIVLESENVIQESMMKSITDASVVKRVAVNGIYTTITGDSLNSIAEEFGISLAQLAIWNSITKDKVNSIAAGQKLAISKIGIESRLSTTEKNKVYKTSTTLFGKQEFIDYIASYAVKIAYMSGEEPLYASVIIAQAIHESAYGSSGLSNPPNYNLTGIKGSYNGQYVKMWTWEHDADFDADVSILANFRKYPSYLEALQDHAEKMRYGTSWDSKIYSGTWVNNTTSYKEATAALDGVYATDPYGYANKLNKYIEQYQLTDYDKYDSFLTKKNVNYSATVSFNNDGIYTKPNGMKDTVLYTSYKYNNKEVGVTEEATTQSGTFVKLVRLEDRGTIGWIKKANIIDYDEFITKKNVDYDAIVLSNNEGIYTKPNGMQGAILYTSYKYNNKNVKVGEEATTASGTFVKLVRIEDNGTIGWIKKSSIQTMQYDTFLTKKNANYTATVLPNNEGIYTGPKGMQGSILYTTYVYNNKKVKVGEEATTASGTFVKLIRIEDRGTIGWIKKASIAIN